MSTALVIIARVAGACAFAMAGIQDSRLLLSGIGASRPAFGDHTAGTASPRVRSDSRELSQGGASACLPMKRQAASPLAALSDRDSGRAMFGAESAGVAPWECETAMHGTQSPARTPQPQVPRGFSASADVNWSAVVAAAGDAGGGGAPVQISATVPFDAVIAANDVGGGGAPVQRSATVAFRGDFPTVTQLWGSPSDAQVDLCFACPLCGVVPAPPPSGAAALRLLELERDVANSPRRAAEQILNMSRELTAMRAKFAAERGEAVDDDIAALRSGLAFQRARADRAERSLHMVVGAQAAAFKQACAVLACISVAASLVSGKRRPSGHSVRCCHAFFADRLAAILGLRTPSACSRTPCEVASGELWVRGVAAV